MEYLATQMALFLLLAVMIGMALGWWGSRRCLIRQEVISAPDGNELAGLRRNYNDIVRDNAQLRVRLQQAEVALRKFTALPSTTDYGDYLATRKALEKLRKQYQSMLATLHQQQHLLQRLRQELASHEAIAKTPAKPETIATIPSPFSPSPAANPVSTGLRRDDLSCFQGLDARHMRQFQAAGLVSYRQLAELNADDVLRIQQLMGLDTPALLADCIRQARHRVAADE